MDQIELEVGSIWTVNGIPQSTLRPVVFTGEKLGSYSRFTGNNDSRGITETLYRTEDGRLVVHKKIWSRWQGEPTIYRLREVSEEDLSVGGEFEMLGRECGYGRPLTLDEALQANESTGE